MSLVGLAELVLSEPTLSGALEDAPDARVPALDLTGPAALRPFVVKGLVDAGRTVLAVAATAREADELAESWGCVMDPRLVAAYPAWETLPHERLSPRSDTVGRRLAVLRRLRHPRVSSGSSAGGRTGRAPGGVAPPGGVGAAGGGAPTGAGPGSGSPGCARPPSRRSPASATWSRWSW